MMALVAGKLMITSTVQFAPEAYAFRLRKTGRTEANLSNPSCNLG